MDVFTLFATTNYDFLQLDSGSGGNKILAEFTANGVVKLRDSMTQVDNVESEDSDASVHIRPTESFLTSVGGNLVGHGMRLTKGTNGPEDYRIIRQVEGFDFDTDILEFIRVELKREAIWEVPSSLPLE